MGEGCRFVIIIWVTHWLKQERQYQVERARAVVSRRAQPPITTMYSVRRRVDHCKQQLHAVNGSVLRYYTRQNWPAEPEYRKGAEREKRFQNKSRRPANSWPPVPRAHTRGPK